MNLTPRWWRALTCAYMPVGCPFNGTANILSSVRLALLKNSDSLDDDLENPLVGRATALNEV